jgi:phage baseplate assembly protein gpV
MSLFVPTVRAIVRAEIDQRRDLALAVVTQVFTGAEDYLAVNAQLRGSDLELQKVPVMVGRAGISAIPRVDDLVVIGFLHGDVNAPLVLGHVYDDAAPPPDAKPDEVVYVVPDEESDEARRLHVELPNGNTLTVTDSKVSVIMGGTTIEVEADGSIKLTAAADLELNADGDIKLKAGGNVNIEAGGDAVLKGTSVTAEGSGEAKLKGANVSIAGNTSFSPA